MIHTYLLVYKMIYTYLLVYLSPASSCTHEQQYAHPHTHEAPAYIQQLQLPDFELTPPAHPRVLHASAQALRLGGERERGGRRALFLHV